MTDVISTVMGETSELIGGVIPATQETFTTKEGAGEMAFALGGLVAATLVGGLMTMIPFQAIPMGNVFRTGSLLIVGAGIFRHGMKNKGEGIGLASLVAGPLLFGAGVAQALAYTGLFPRLQTMLTKDAESGYFGDMTLDGYETIDSVEVDRSSYQPTQDYGAEGEESPQVEIASRMEADPIDSVRQEPAMGHGVTQWFGAERLNSAVSGGRHASMKKFAASTDVNGNRIKTGDTSMANVVGGTSMSDSPDVVATAYDVDMEAGVLPQTKELGGGVQDVFDTYILPTYEMPSAGGSGHGVTQWYADSNQTGFIGNFVAGAEGHGSVLGQ
jgi:hypothetical protein